MATIPPPKLTKAEAGRLGATQRWGDGPRVVKMADLRPEQRRLVQALVDALRANERAEGRQEAA